MKERMISLALFAAVSIGITPAFAQVTQDAASIGTNDSLLADCMIQKKHACRRVYKKCATKRKATKKVAQQVVKTETKTVEKPAVVQPVQEQQIEQKAETIQQPAVVESCQPVIIDRFERRHRSLIHLGLFPFSLFGQ